MKPTNMKKERRDFITKGLVNDVDQGTLEKKNKPNVYIDFLCIP